MGWRFPQAHTFAPPTAGWQPTRTWGVFDLYGPEQRQAVQKGFGGFTGISGVAAERSVVRRYLWGQDLSGTMTGAGGVGGLLSVTHQGVTYHTCSDANGNLTGLLAANGEDAGKLVARFDYDPFGNRLTNTGPDVEICPMGFSTKYTDSETGLVDYGLRIYSPPLARFASRDPIEESGGVNLYGFVGNDPVNRVDYLGLWATVVHHQIIDDFLANRGIRGAVECKCCGKIDVADILKRANARMDGITYPGGEPDGNYTPGSPSWEAQHPRNAYQHGMHNNTGFRRQTPQQAEQQFNQFVNQALAGAAQHAIDCADREHESKSGWPCDDIRSGINELGTAIHSLTDSLSPAHEGFQAWPPFNPTLPAIAPIIGSSTANAAANAAAMREHANRENMDAYNNRKPRVQDLMNGRVGQLLKSLLGCCENAYK